MGFGNPHTTFSISRHCETGAQIVSQDFSVANAPSKRHVMVTKPSIVCRLDVISNEVRNLVCR